MITVYQLFRTSRIIHSIMQTIKATIQELKNRFPEGQQADAISFVPDVFIGLIAVFFLYTYFVIRGALNWQHLYVQSVMISYISGASITLILWYHRKLHASIITYCIITTFCLCLLILRFGPTSGFQIMFLLLAVIPMMYFRERKSVMLMIYGFLLSAYYGVMFSGIEPFTLATPKQLHEINLIVSCLSMPIAISHMYKFSVRVVQQSELQLKAQIEIQEQLNFTTSLIETIPSPIFYKDIEGKYMGCNSSFEEYIGLDKSKIVGSTVFDIAPSPLAGKYHQADIDLVMQKGRQEYESQVRYADGTFHDVIFYKSTFTGKGQEPLGIIGLILDITERKKMERELIQREEYFRMFYENSPLGIVLKPADENTPKIFNKKFCNMMGYEVGELKTFTIEELTHPEDSSLHIPYMEKMLAEEIDDFSMQKRYIRKDGEIMWADIYVANIYSGEGERISHVSMFLDVTEKKKAEIELEASNDALRKANQELDRFVYSASHDLRAPLTSVLGLVELSKNEQPVEALAYYLDLMEVSLHKLDNFIRDIVHYSRNSRMGLSTKKIEFKELIEEGIAQHNFMEHAHRIETIIEITGAEVFYSDESRLKIIINNMISNAFRYADPSKSDPYLHITAAISAEKAVLSFMDNGIGISEEHLQKVFEMFYRATTASKGSGIGLFIAKECVDKLQGTIDVQSKERKGTTFIITLPSLQGQDV